VNISVVETRIGGLEARSAADLAAELTRLIRSGELAEGDALPTVRRVAELLGVSVGTVADAWATLRSHHLIETRRRGGTRVIRPAADREFTGWESVDLLLSSPDTTLQPSIEGALLHALRQPRVNAWGREPMVPALASAVAPSWPFAAESFTTAGGGTEGLWLAARAARQGDRPIAIEEPAPPGFLAALAAEGIAVIGVGVDAEGPVPASLQRALDAGAGTLLHQPGGPFSPAHVLSAERAEALSDLLSASDVLVVEDDSLGPLSTVPVRSLGARLPERTVRVLSFCKAFGLDLRTSVLGGADHLVDRAARLRSGGIASNSRILQYALAAMLTDPAVAQRVAEARSRYAVRRALALTAFADAGLVVHSGPGSQVLWVEVPDERATALALATRGIVVEGSASAFIEEAGRDLLRVSVLQLPEEPARIGELADLFVRAGSGDLRVRFD
jgi:DNA-binding transcriptional MocR family regulator